MAAVCLLQGCASNRLIDTAVMGGPKVFVVATLASSKPAAPFAFRNYELPDEVAPVAQQLAACAGSCKHHVWEVRHRRPGTLAELMWSYCIVVQYELHRLSSLQPIKPSALLIHQPLMDVLEGCVVHWS